MNNRKQQRYDRSLREASKPQSIDRVIAEHKAGCRNCSVGYERDCKMLKLLEVEKTAQSIERGEAAS